MAIAAGLMMDTDQQEAGRCVYFAVGVQRAVSI